MIHTKTEEVSKRHLCMPAIQLIPHTPKFKNTSMSDSSGG